MTRFRSYRGHSVLVDPLSRTPPVVLDVGANRGEFSRDLARDFGGEYHLVEANPDLVGEIRAAGEFDVLGVAISDTRGTARFNVARNDEASSILTLPDESPYGAELVRVVEVDQMSLDDLVRARGGGVDVLKLDIEGAELPALGGADEATLRSVGQVTVEFHCGPEHGFGGREEVLRLLDRWRRSGFVVLNFSAPQLTDVLMLSPAMLEPSRLDRSRWRVLGVRLRIRGSRIGRRGWRRFGLRSRLRGLARHVAR